jgi:hypothetical protein
MQRRYQELSSAKPLMKNIGIFFRGRGKDISENDIIAGTELKKRGLWNWWCFSPGKVGKFKDWNFW